MSSTLERRVVTVGGLRVGDGPAVVISNRVSLRTAGVPQSRSGEGEVDHWFAEGALVEPASAADLPAIAARAAGVVVGASWTRDFPLVREAAATRLPIVVERRPGASLEEWLGVADYCAAQGNDHVILCETGLDLALLQRARASSGRPVIADVSGNVALAGAAVAAGADGLIVGAALDGSGDGAAAALEEAALIGALVRPETPATLAECRQAIDRVDAALATLLERRAAIAGIVQGLKPVGGFAGRDPERERALVARMAGWAPTLGEERLAPIMNAVIEAGLLLAEEG
ncbi:chorismate mutase [Nonomuraea sediminis]|uniref:chorismate mutase n=1 Tax=Nonomuraea sediminis TaxID=2835864 RepID=UPI001BDCE799|nr:chorismate mutase [Nonomuraea sediminis]